MVGVFISYRLSDSRHAAGRLAERLEKTFSPKHLFMDVDGIAPGLDFVDVLNERVAACDVFLAVIGPHWLDVKDEFGARRLDNANDFVRIELEAALNRKIRVIPVLVDGAQMPRESDLPGPLRPLARRNAVRLTHERFAADCAGLATSLRSSETRTRTPKPGANSLATLAAICTIIVGVPLLLTASEIPSRYLPFYSDGPNLDWHAIALWEGLGFALLLSAYVASVWVPGHLGRLVLALLLATLGFTIIFEPFVAYSAALAGARRPVYLFAMSATAFPFCALAAWAVCRSSRSAR